MKIIQDPFPDITPELVGKKVKIHDAHGGNLEIGGIYTIETVFNYATIKFFNKTSSWSCSKNSTKHCFEVISDDEIDPIEYMLELLNSLEEKLKSKQYD